MASCDYSVQLQKRSKIRDYSTRRFYSVGIQTGEDYTPNTSLIPTKPPRSHPAPTPNSAAYPSRLRQLTQYGDYLSQLSAQQLSLPFIGYIRKHEKIYAREIGLLKVALRECRVFYTKLLQMAQETHAHNPHVRVYDNVCEHIQSHTWLFDPHMFTVRVYNKKHIQDPVDVFAQSRIYTSYMEALQQEYAALQQQDTGKG
ncbi:hypothetical protein EON64_01360 [archaeon]|nr:MAG: hypothetical protein EON64_01360 [archaeon]